jgi:two-component sensor histidine kinase
LTDQARKVKKYNKEGWTLLEFDGFWNIYIADEIATEDNYNTYIISLFDFPSIPELLNSDIDIFDYVINNLAKIDRIGKPTSESYVTTYWEDNISFDLLLKSVEASLYNFFKTTISGVRNGYDKSKYNPMLSTVYYKPEINGINEDDRTNILRTQSYRISHGIKNTIGLIITDFGNDIEDLRSIARTKTLNKDKTTEPNIDDIVKRLEGYHVELSDLEARFDALNKAHSRRKEDLNIKEVDLRDEVEEVYEKKVKPYAKNKGIKTKLIYKDISSTKGPIKVNISVDEIKEEVLLNLMKNSIDHGYPKKKSAILTFEVSKVDENYVNISYRDNGIGIKPSNWKDNYFYAFSDTTKTPLNTGLQIIAATVELHGCKIDTYEKNEVIIGFNFTLPKN